MKKKFVLMTCVLLVVCISSLFLFACASDKEETPPPAVEEDKPVETKPTLAEVKEKMVDAIFNSFAFDGKKPVGFEYDLELPLDDATYMVYVSGYLDQNNINESKMGIKVTADDELVFNISADDEYLFFTTKDAKRRFVNFNLADTIDKQTFPSKDGIKESFVGALPSMLLDLIYNDEENYKIEENNDGIKYTINGNLEMLATMLDNLVGGISPSLQGMIEDALGDLKSKLSIQVDKDGKVMRVYVDVSDYYDTYAGSIYAKIDNYKPIIKTPAKDDPSYIESKVLNFRIEGTVNMNTVTPYNETTLATYNYELYADLDLFTMLRNAITKDANGVITFDPTKLFDVEDSSLYFNLSHICDGSDGCGKVESSNGSILTIAFSPKDFGSKELFLSIKPLSILPKGFLADAMGLGNFTAGIIEGLLKGQMGTNIDIAALFEEIVIDEPSAMSYEIAGIPTNVNIIGIIMRALDVLGEIRLDAMTGLRVGINEVIDLVNEFAPIIDAGNINIPLAINQLFSNATHMYVKIDNSAYGDPDIANMNFYQKFMTIDEKVGEYKFNEDRPGPVIKVEPIRDNNGDIVIISDNVTAYDITDKDGIKTYKKLPMSKAEMEIMLANPMAIPYNYETVTGVKGEARVLVYGINGFDIGKTGSQKVEIVTGIADGMTTGSISPLINVINGLPALGINLEIQGEVFESTMEVAPNPTKVEFTQATSLPNRIEDKTYTFGEKIDTTFDLVITYGEGDSKVEKVVKNVKPINGQELIVSGSIKAIDSFDLVYDYNGFKMTKNIKMTKPEIAKAIKDENIKIETGKTYNRFGSNIKFTVSGEKETSIALVKEYNTTFVTPEGVEIVKELKNDGSFSKYAVTFSKAGNYTIIMNMNGGFTKKFNFEVVDPKAPIPALPSFVATLNAKDGGFLVTMGRTNQISDVESVKVALKVEAINVGEDATNKVLTFGEDYKIKRDGAYLDANELNLKAFQGRADKFEIEFMNETYNTIKITFNATEYDNAKLGEASNIA